MISNRLSSFVRTVAVTLTIAVPLVAVGQDHAWAMLAPARLSAPPAPESTVDQRQADLQTIERALESKVLRQRLHDLGYKDDEIQSRLSKLSDQDVHQMASQIRTINPGGDATLFGILILVVLVLLIIYLFKRI